MKTLESGNKVLLLILWLIKSATMVDHLISLTWYLTWGAMCMLSIDGHGMAAGLYTIYSDSVESWDIKTVRLFSYMKYFAILQQTCKQAIFNI